MKKDNNSFQDALGVANRCISSLKNSSNTRDILFELLKTFEADDAVLLSANANNQGIDLGNSCMLKKDRTYLGQYADSYWRLDPLYQLQFSNDRALPVFKTDDIIPYSQLVNLEYYTDFLMPQDVLGELIIKLGTEKNVLGAISLQRRKERPGFASEDINMASLLAPVLFNVFDCARNMSMRDDERLVLERWMESRPEGILLIGPDYVPVYINSKGKAFCYEMDRKRNPSSGDPIQTEPQVLGILMRDCMTLADSQERFDPAYSTNRILSLRGSDKRYYIQYFYFPLVSRGAQEDKPHFMVFVHEVTSASEYTLPGMVVQYQLSEREEIIAQLAAGGLTNKQIAERLCISPFTVQNHLKSIFEKTGLDSRTKLAHLLKF